MDGSEPPAMRPGTSSESSTIQLTEADYLAAISPLAHGSELPVDRSRALARLLDPRALIDELWRISHFGWMPEAAIRRALTLAAGREIPSESVHQALRQLLDRGWVEQREGEADDGEQRWRLSDGGRRARVS